MLRMIFSLLCVAAATLAPLGSADAQTPRFSQSGPLTSDAGYFMVEWQADRPVALEMTAQDRSSAPRVLYEGKNKALFVSGLADGEYMLRLRDRTGAMSPALKLIVQHQSLTRALWLVALGMLAFLATMAVILRGPRDE